MRKIIFLSVFSCGILNAQTERKVFSDCARIQTVMFLGNDIIAVQCDTVYVLNKLTFKLYNSAYLEVRRKGISMANLTAAYDEVIKLQEERLDEQQKSYSSLKQDFNSLSGQAQATLAESSNRLTSALASLDNLNRDLVETKKLLGEAKSIIETERNWLNLERVLWGVGGFAIGVVVGAVVAR